MMFKSKLATFVGALVLAGSSFAAQGVPQSCPGINAIQSEGLPNAGEIFQGMYLAYNVSNYATPSNWVFIMGPVMADSEEMALESSNDLLATMSGTPEPQNDNEGNWICEYDTGEPNVAALAIQADDMISPLNMARFLRRAH
jgi:hypothetical protein